MTSSSTKCLYCEKKGHTINYCNDESIKLLDDEMREKSIFGILVLPSKDKAEMYIIKLLKSLSKIQLIVLYNYNYKIRKNFACIDKKLKITYINILIKNYFQDENVLLYSKKIEKMEKITDKKYKIYSDEVLKLIDDLYYYYNIYDEYVNVLTYTKNKINFYRIIQRKFDICLENMYSSPRIELNENMNDDECPICYEIYSNNDLIKTNCDHNYCRECLIRYLKSLNEIPNKEPCCALCRQQIKKLKIMIYIVN